MNRIQQLQLMAQYNQWMNEKLYAAAATLSDEALFTDRKAFFGSLFNTLSHLVAADTIWLKRFARHPGAWPSLVPVTQLPDPPGLSTPLFDRLDALAERRQMLDRQISDWTAELSEADLDVTLHYSNTAGVQGRRNFHALLTHFFNHQTHHRGQITTLLSQSGVDVGTTDLLALIGNEGEG